MATNTSQTTNVSNIMYQYNKELIKRRNKAIKEIKEELIPKYLKNGITSIELHYDGCGDSGEMTEAIASNKDNEIITDTSEEGKNLNIYEDWSEVCYDLLTYDWYNNEGGGGVIYIDLENMEIEVDGYYNDTVQVTPENSEQQTHFDLNEII